MPFFSPVGCPPALGLKLTPAWYSLPQSWRWLRLGTNWMLFCSVSWRRVTWTGWALSQLGVIGGWEPWHFGPSGLEWIWVGPQNLA